jgi:hypothetical protein
VHPIASRRTPESFTEKIDETFNTNCKGMLFTVKYAARQMIKQGGAATVNTGSDLAYIGLANLTAYTASKSAVVGVTRTLAVELALRETPLHIAAAHLAAAGANNRRIARALGRSEVWICNLTRQSFFHERVLAILKEKNRDALESMFEMQRLSDLMSLVEFPRRSARHLCLAIIRLASCLDSQRATRRAVRKQEKVPMKFMLIFDWNPDAETRTKAVLRFRAGGLPPEGVKLLGRWTRADLSGGFDLIEAEDETKLFEFAYMWGDLMKLEIFPVLDDQQLSAALERATKR